MLVIGVEPEYRSVAISLSGRGPKGEANVSIATGSEDAYFFRLLTLLYLFFWPAMKR
jgi:hypothetical protein